MTPDIKPRRPEFSSGPCAKRPGWNMADVLDLAFLGRSHRAARPREQIAHVIEKTRSVLEIPDNYRIAVVPASNTGAIEMAMWSMLGAAPVDMLVWEVFGQEWHRDITEQLKLENARLLKADFGEMPDLSAVRPDADVIFTWNGTTSGARVPDADWISADRTGLTFCDATSGAFAQNLDWSKLDVTSFSWQKAMGGEGAHGMLVLSPKAVERLLSYTPDRALPKIFRLVKNGALIEGAFTGATLNTPSMLCMADYLDALNWAEELGGLTALQDRADTNFTALQSWVDKTDWIENLVRAPHYRSNTSVCLKIIDPRYLLLNTSEQWQFLRKMAALLEEHDVAYDILMHLFSVPGLRIWCGTTVDTDDIIALTPWLDWAFEQSIQG